MPLWKLKLDMIIPRVLKRKTKKMKFATGVFVSVIIIASSKSKLRKKPCYMSTIILSFVWQWILDIFLLNWRENSRRRKCVPAEGCIEFVSKEVLKKMAEERTLRLSPRKRYMKFMRYIMKRQGLENLTLIGISKKNDRGT